MPPDDNIPPPLLRSWDATDADNIVVDSITPNVPNVPTVNPYAKKPPVVPQLTINHSERLIIDNGNGHSFTVPSEVDGALSVTDIALFIRQSHSLFKDTDFVNRVRSIDFATTTHLTSTQRHIHRIFECLKCHPRLKFLADLIPDPEAVDKMIR